MRAFGMSTPMPQSIARTAEVSKGNDNYFIRSKTNSALCDTPPIRVKGDRKLSRTPSRYEPHLVRAYQILYRCNLDMMDHFIARESVGAL
jgi:hypothetical protein